MAIGSGTTPLGIHYLLPGEAPDLAGITQQSANDIDGLITPLRADTGWISITSALASGFVAASGVDAPQVRTKGGIVYYRGAVSRTGGYSVNTNYTLVAAGGIPAAHRPSVPSGGIGQITRSIGSAGGTTILASVFNDGRLTVTIGPNAPTWVDLSGLAGFTTD